MVLGTKARLRRSKRREGQRGAVLVEFGIISIVLFTLLFGIIEFGWTFYQFQDTRHGAREGARLAAVDYNPTNAVDSRAGIIAETCARMDDATGRAFVSMTRTGATIGSRGTITVRRTVSTLTGFLDAQIPDSVTSSIDFRLEQPASWSSSATEVPC